jgi:hypothetical protein
LSPMWKLPSPFNMKSHPRAEGTRGTTLFHFTRIGTERQFGGHFLVTAPDSWIEMLEQQLPQLFAAEAIRFLRAAFGSRSLTPGGFAYSPSHAP